MSFSPLRAEKARRPFGFRSRTRRKERRIRREFFRQTCRTGTRQFLVSFPQPLALLGTRTLFSRRDKFSRNWLRNRFRPGGHQEALPWLTLGGGEVFSAGLRLAADRLPGVDLFQMDACQIPFENEFDVIGAFDVLEHIGDDELVLSQRCRAVRQGGGILLAFRNIPSFGARSMNTRDIYADTAYPS